MNVEKLADISIVIPAYNEQARIVEPMSRLRAFLDSRAEGYEVIFVDDGSKDATSAVISAGIADWPSARLITLPANVGKGGAVQQGVLAATKKNLCFMDADLSTDLEMLPRLFAVLSDETPVVIGSRDVRGAEIVVHQNFFREYTAKIFNLWIQLWLLPGIWDTQCGFKLFRAPVAKRIFADLRENGFGFDIEVLYRAKKLGCPILEVPVRWTNVLDSRVRPVRHGMAMALQVVKTRLGV